MGSAAGTAAAAVAGSPEAAGTGADGEGCASNVASPRTADLVAASGRKHHPCRDPQQLTRKATATALEAGDREAAWTVSVRTDDSASPPAVAGVLDHCPAKRDTRGGSSGRRAFCATSPGHACLLGEGFPRLRLEPLPVVVLALLGIAKHLNRLVKGEHVFSRGGIGSDVRMVLAGKSPIAWRPSALCRRLAGISQQLVVVRLFGRHYRVRNGC